MATLVSFNSWQKDPGVSANRERAEGTKVWQMESEKGKRRPRCERLIGDVIQIQRVNQNRGKDSDVFVYKGRACFAKKELSLDFALEFCWETMMIDFAKTTFREDVKENIIIETLSKT